jgi:ubiquinone/menaquinone biosynthesis C-methylase UbiE
MSDHCESGLEEGMRVLDIGCGSGDVTRLAAETVGPSGAVVGIDRDEQAVRAARERASAHGIANVSFEVGEGTAAAEPGAFDALVGRFVLMHQRDPAELLGRAARAVRAGGVVLFLESHMAALLDGQHSFPHSSLYDRVVRWKCRVVAAGADIEAGLRLHATFLAAGLPEPRMHMEACIGGGDDSVLYRYMAESVRSMLPMAAREGIDGFEPDEVASLETRLREEVVSSGGVIVCWPAVVAWCRMPAESSAKTGR